MKPTSTRPRGTLVILASLLGALVQLPLVSGQESEPYLRGPQGPYRGRVVELLTDTPLPGAAVLVIWQSADSQIAGLRNLFAFREALTDGAGEFVLDASSVETNLPPRTFQPRFFIFKPGYTTFPRETRSPPGAPAARFTGSGSVIQLRPLRREEDRIEAFNTFVSGVNRAGVDIFSDVWFPQIARLLRQELEHFGVPVPKPAAPGATH